MIIEYCRSAVFVPRTIVREEMTVEEAKKKGAPMNLVERIETVRSGKTDSNCFGTALYLTGIIETDTLELENSTEEYLKELELLQEPEVNCLMVLRHDGTLTHMAVVTQTDPLLVMHRIGKNSFDTYGPFEENMPFEADGVI